ncbi:MAG TPA: alpha/beta hydrolase [Nocardioides sp.]|uniref:PGAP1-like alpha/beta domain-containing protein n=1 Tax=Nocardioides sp. TaxID=35761 RepID=UPI002C813CFC|nr:alpha/beta hydrolase [Nocardioides sp.]HTW18473.1 alpha/beta hydrolase [Nocardioides sp.]
MSDRDYTVVGGSHGVEADLEDMDAAGGLIRSKGWNVGETALATHKYVLDANLLSSAVLAPATFATFESGLLGALDGPGGLSANAVRMTATGSFLQAKAAALATTDRALEYLVDVRQHTQGLVFGLGLTTAPLPTAAVTALALWQGDFFEDPSRWLLEHPDVLEEVVASTPGLLDFFMPGVGFPADAEQGAALLALLYDQDLGGLTSEQDEEVAPASLADAMRKLDEMADQPDAFKIERVGTPPHEVYNVYLPGTKAFDGPFPAGTPGLPDELTDSGLVQNLGTNFAGVAGADNAYVEAVLRAMREAGIPPDAPVNLLGHSQGGIVAARVAEAVSHGEGGRSYRIDNVVTAGSPVDHVELPDDVSVLSLVNEYDIVPRLDGEAYGDDARHTTIVTEVQTGSVAGNHSMTELYRPMVDDLEASDDPAVRDALDRLSGLHPGGGSTAWTFHMARG